MANPSFTREAPVLKTARAFEAQLPLNEPVLTSFKRTTPWGPTLWVRKSSPGWQRDCHRGHPPPPPSPPPTSSCPQGPSPGGLAAGPSAQTEASSSSELPGRPCRSPVWKGPCISNPRATLPPAPSPPSCLGEGRPLTLDPPLLPLPRSGAPESAGSTGPSSAPGPPPPV